MLVLTTGLMVLASVLWLSVYWSMGQQFSVSISLAFQALSAGTIAFYLRTRKLQLFAMIQLGLILFTPFAMQWSIGNFVTASGVSLWGLIAPVGAVTVLGTRQSLPWFFAWLFMTVLAGIFDFLLSDAPVKVDMQTVAVFFVLNFAAISLMIYALLWYFANEKQKLRSQVDLQHEELRVEKEKSERLLLNVLPRAIAERLKTGESNIAQGHADVTVMFADIVGFTKMTEELSPAETVKILNDVFSMFDEIAEKYGVEKIKTIGDAYMAAAGAESGAQVHYADAVANMAIEMLERMNDYRQRSGENIELRIGIGTGPVIAGVIGKKKFIYDMWGDTVNVASRMAGDAYTGSVQVDLTTYRRLHSRFKFDAPHEVEIKGKGRMQVHHLLERQ
ncbi:MAG: adenylate/guanylate cyclase domain-containing protein [Betaproteobacteria bacterium]|nr:adenylate/guanylate cyclase domain-containing protein [Betaproteobacteria bacterium]